MLDNDNIVSGNGCEVVQETSTNEKDGMYSG